MNLTRTVVSIDSLLVHNSRYYFQVYLSSCTYKIVNTHMTDYFDGNLFKSNQN